MGDAGGQSNDDRRVEFLGYVVGQLGELKALGRIGRFQHRKLGADGVMTGILLVLGGVHPRVIGHGDDHPGVHAGVGGRV